MNWIIFFNQYIEPKFPSGSKINRVNFQNGDFGDLTRVEFEVKSTIGAVEFWSKGWVAIYAVDKRISEQIINILCSPDEESKINDSFYELIRVLNDS